MNEDYLLPDDYEEETTLEDVQEEQEDYSFDDVEETETVEAEDTDSVEEVETETVEETTTNEEATFKLPFKYNHADGEITDIAEAQRLVQIGMMYQNKVQPEYEALKSIKEPFEKINKIADLYGMDVDTLYDALYNQYLESQSEETGYTVEQIRKDRELQEREQERDSWTRQQEQEKANADMYSKFLQEYPDVTADKIKPETWALVEKGTDLTTAYTKQLNKELQDQLKIQTQNTKNKSTSPIKSTTINGGGEPQKQVDDFLDGFWSN